MTIQESMQRILQSEDIFGEVFYKTFFARCPEAEAYFKGIDMKRQALSLTMTMTLIEQFYTNTYAAVRIYLQYLGMRHHDREIPPELYPKMLDAILESLEEFHGSDWDDNLSRQWHTAISLASQQMLKGYDQRISI